MTVRPLILSSYTLVSAMGRGLTATHQALAKRRSGLRPCDFEDIELETYIGRVDELDGVTLPGDLARYDCRNNRLVELALQTDSIADAILDAKRRYGGDRIAVILGTSTSGMQECERAYRNRDTVTRRLPDSFDFKHTHDLFSSARFVRARLGLAGFGTVISTACSSSAKTFLYASHLIEAGLCEAAVVGGIDSLCSMTLHGFAALELLAKKPCRPFDAERNGISIGEAAGLALLERQDRAPRNGIALVGYGASSDAYHMSTPPPDGHGAVLAMREALDSAGLAPRDIDYVNLHGTGTKTNDSAEDKAIVEVFGTDTPCSSTKAWSGHALGSAGILEAVISAITIEHGVIPGCLNIAKLDPALQARIVTDNQPGRVRRVLSNSFGFGGNNCSLVFSQSPA